MLVKLLIVGLGGACGAMLRYAASRGALALLGPSFPWGTLLVNVVGCFAAGFVLQRLINHEPEHPGRLLVAVGVLGGLTTFSAFSVETLMMAQKQQWALAAANIGANVILSIAAAAAGFAVAR